MTAAFALRHVTLETQSRGKLHTHSRVKNVMWTDNSCHIDALLPH